MHKICTTSVENPCCVNLSISVNGLYTFGVELLDIIVGPFFIDGILIGVKYRDFLENHLPPFLEDVFLDVTQRMWFPHDGCPPDFSRVTCQTLDREYNGRWIGREGH